jgi:hypothetical protein
LIEKPPCAKASNKTHAGEVPSGYWTTAVQETRVLWLLVCGNPRAKTVCAGQTVLGIFKHGCEAKLCLSTGLQVDVYRINLSTFFGAAKPPLAAAVPISAAIQ